MPSSNSWAWIDEFGRRDPFDGAPPIRVWDRRRAFLLSFICFFFGGGRPAKSVAFFPSALSQSPFFFFFRLPPFSLLPSFFSPPRVSFLPFLFFSCPTGLRAESPAPWPSPAAWPCGGPNFGYAKIGPAPQGFFCRNRKVPSCSLFGFAPVLSSPPWGGLSRLGRGQGRGRCGLGRCAPWFCPPAPRRLQTASPERRRARPFPRRLRAPARRKNR